MERKHNKNLLPFAKELRKHMTKEEKHLWYDFLRTYPLRFMRQKTIGRYIVDFYCAEAQIVVELDGSQHYEDIHLEKDKERDLYLQSYGLTVIRIPNNAIANNFRGVCEYIDLTVQQSLRPRLRSATSLYTREAYGVSAWVNKIKKAVQAMLAQPFLM